MGLQQFERRLERLVEGAFAKAFRSGLQPVELARRLTREMDLQRSVGVRGESIAPNRFVFALSPSDYERFSGFAGALSTELITEARDHARTESYQLLGPIEVELEEAASLTAGTFQLSAEVAQGADGPPAGAIVLPDGRRFDVSSEAIRIGRLGDCDIVLEDDLVSRNHAEVRRLGQRAVIVDLGSKNGTQVNGSGVRERALVGGEEIRVGSTTLRYEAP